MSEQFAYKFRIYPNTLQKELFAKTFGCVRKVYNLMLDDRITTYEKFKAGEIDKLNYQTPAFFKKDYPFLKEVDSLALANAQQNLDKAFKNFFKKKDAEFPKFKSKRKSKNSYTTNNQKGTVQIIDNKYLKLPKFKQPIKVKVHRPVEGIIKSVTISKNAANQYFASILCEKEITPYQQTDKMVGIDFGIKALAILSTGQVFENQKNLFKMQDKLKKEQKKLSRKYQVAKASGKDLQDCSNYQKQKLKVAKIHNKIKNQREDLLNKLTTKIIKEFDIICLEDLSVKEMMKNKRLAKAIGDVSWSSFVSKLEYKAKWHNKTIIKVDKYYPSSKTCNICDTVSKDIVSSLSIRKWTCPSCGTNHDRDVNAAINILQQGMKIHLNTIQSSEGTTDIAWIK